MCLHFPPVFHFSFLLRSPIDSFALRVGAEGCKCGTWCALPPLPPSLDSLSERDWCKPFAQPQTLQGHHMAGLDKTLWYFYTFIPNQLRVNPWHPSKGTRLFIQRVKKHRLTLTLYQLTLQITPKLAKRTSLMSCKP